ncbi:MAG: 4a-hydroxytetrahydrobiopterin dehydratase [Nitrospinae bacterium]|nr:4a-hydroxytetrahydrobiopterin dehydratase [Nitrospinota bacterium]
MSSEKWTENGGALSRIFKFGAYLDGVEFARKVAVIADKQDHHPDITIGYRKVTVTATTHDKGNTVTEKDWSLAQAIDEIGAD